MSIHMLLILIVAVGVRFFVICILGFVGDLRRHRQEQPIKSEHSRIDSLAALLTDSLTRCFLCVDIRFWSLGQP